MLNCSSAISRLGKVGFRFFDFRWPRHLRRRVTSGVPVEILRGLKGISTQMRRKAARSFNAPAMIELLEPRTLLSAAPVNLVTNSGFESGFSNWSWIPGGSAVTSYSVDSTVSHSGASSTKLAFTSPAGSSGYAAIQQTVSGLTVGNSYFISAWVDGSNVGSGAQIGTNDSSQTRVSIPTGSYGWTQITLSFVATASSVPIVIAVPQPTTALWVDDVSVIANGTLSANGGFEAGTSGWNWISAGTSTANYAVDTTNAHSGTQSLRLSDSTPNSPGVYGAISQTIAGLTIGNSYYVSAWVQGSGVGSAAQFGVNTNSSYPRVSIPSGTYGWTQLRLSFVADATSALILFAVGDPTTSLWVDDVSVTDSPNVVTNGSFLQNGTSGWSWFTSGGAVATETLDPTVIHTYGSSVKLTDSTPSGSGVFGDLYQTVSGMTVGHTYVVNAYVKGSGVGVAAQLGVNGASTFPRTSIPQGTYGWTLVTTSFVADASTAQVFILVGDPTTALWVADVSVADKSATTNANWSSQFGFMGSLVSANTSPASTAAAMSSLEQVGAGWVRIDGSFPTLEPTKGTFDWTTLDNEVADALARGLTPLVALEAVPTWATGSSSVWAPPVDLNDYATFITAAVNRYKNSVHAWEVWNEENNSTVFFQGNVNQFVNVLKAGYTAAKLADPSCTVVLGGLGLVDTTYLNAIYERGGGKYFDVVGDHPYQFGTVTDSLYYTNDLIALRNVMNAAGDTNKPIWLTEFGFTTSSSGGSYFVTEQQQAQQLAQNSVANLTLKTMGVTETFWYSGPDRTDGFGLLRSDGTAKPAYSAYQTFTNTLGNSTYRGVVSGGFFNRRN